MYNGGKVLIGILVFLALLSSPIWYNQAMGDPAYQVELEKASRGDDCIRPAEWMTANHMDLLNEWRDQVVRDDERFETGADGVVYERSLSHTCLNCHENKDKFCDRCHDYLAVEPYCWECHLVPKEVQP
jgi:hypothetical protein